MTHGSARLTEIESIEVCYETAEPSSANWKHRWIDDEASERTHLLRLRCVPAGLRRSTGLFAPRAVIVVLWSRLDEL